jgi:protein-S-isoprenylcysteine O-methyltransferase Ste14
MGLLWITLHVLPALDRRYNLKASVPTIISIAAGILAIIGMALTSQSGIYNEYMAVAVKVDSDQKVVSTGPYALVRHPMYTGYVLYFGFTPIALGSWWGIAPAFCFLLVIVWRLFDEENYLRKNLEGYPAYCAKVRWHLIPYLF